MRFQRFLKFLVRSSNLPCWYELMPGAVANADEPNNRRRTAAAPAALTGPAAMLRDVIARGRRNVGSGTRAFPLGNQHR